MKKLLWTFISSLILGCSGVKVGPKTAEPESQQISDNRLAKIRLTDLDGQPRSLRDFAGRPVFLNFWATWCRPCVAEMASIERLRATYGDQIVFLAVSHEPLETIRTFRREHDFSLEMARLENGYIDVFVVSLPTTMLIDRTGRLIEEVEGARDWMQFNNQEKVRSLLP